MRSRLAAGEYSSSGWDGLAADLDTMFENAMSYNPAGRSQNPKPTKAGPKTRNPAGRSHHPNAMSYNPAGRSQNPENL